MPTNNFHEHSVLKHLAHIFYLCDKNKLLCCALFLYYAKTNNINNKQKKKINKIKCSGKVKYIEQENQRV